VAAHYGMLLGIANPWVVMEAKLEMAGRRADIEGVHDASSRCSDQPSAFAGRRDTHLLAKLIFASRLALGDARHLGFVHTVNLFRVPALLRGRRLRRDTTLSTEHSPLEHGRDRPRGVVRKTKS
jgi:hypothetical protein